MNLRTLNLQSCTFSLYGAPRDQGEVSESVKLLSGLKGRWQTCELEEVELGLTSPAAVHFVAYISRVMQIQRLKVTSSTWSCIELLLGLPNLRIDHIAITLPSGPPRKPIKQPHDDNLFANQSLKSLTLNYSYSIDSSYEVLHQDLLKCADTLTTLVLDLNEKDYLTCKYLPVFLSRASLLEKLTLRNFRFPNKASYVTFCSYFSNIRNLKELSLVKF